MNINCSPTTIGDSPFYGCSKIEEVSFDCENVPSFFKSFPSVKKVTLSKNVKSIDNNAFMGCSGLTSVTIPNNVTSIGNNAFMGCSGLTSVTIGNSVTSIGDYAFRECSGLTSVNINCSPKTIGNSPFYKCYKIEEVSFDCEKVTSLFNSFSSVKKVTLSKNVKTIGDNAFNLCSGLTSIAIPNGVTSIGERAFENCYALTSLNLPDELTSIGNYAFNYCSGLKSITIPNGVLSIGKSAFGYWGELSKIDIPESVKIIDDQAFYGCSNLKMVYLYHKTPPTINSQVFNSNPYIFVRESALSAYQSIESLRNYDIRSKELDVIELDGKFYYLYAIDPIAEITSSPNHYGDIPKMVIPESIIYNNKNYVVKYIGDYAFSGCGGLISVSIPNGVKEIGKYAFSGCNYMNSISIPNNVTSIGDHAFYECSGLTSVSIPNSVITIGESAFYGCSSMNSISISNNVTSIGNHTFQGCSSLTSVSIPNSVITIGESAFYECSSLKSVTIPSSVTTIGYNAFHKCYNLASVNISAIEAWCDIDFGSESSNPLRYAQHLYINNEEIKDLVIPNGVTAIKKNAFYNCAGLTSVTIPNSITNIGESAFYSCAGIQSINIPSSINLINESTFAYCSGMTSLVLTEGLTIIKKQAFLGCSSLESITIPSSVENIYQDAFSYCYGLKYINALSKTPPFLYDNSFSDYNTPVIVPTESVDEYKEAQGWKNFYNINDKTYYKLVYKVDGAEYKTYNNEVGTDITPEEEPTKEGYTFSGWSEIPSYMPANDVTVSGSFTVNKYTLTYLIENEVYNTLEIEYGLKVNKEEAPTKEGYVFSGLREIPETMPSHNVEINGRFYLPGDTNGDGVVNIADIVEIVNFINKKPSENFDELAANVTGDDKIDEDDISAVLGIIMNK